MIEWLSQYWFIILISGLIGIRLFLMINQRYMEKSIDHFKGTKKDLENTLIISGLAITLLFLGVASYFFFIENWEIKKLIPFLGISLMGIFLMFGPLFFNKMEQRENKWYEKNYKGKIHGTLPKGFEKKEDENNGN